MSYDLEPMKAPVANGAKLRTLVGLIENPVTGPLLAKTLLSNAGILQFREVPAVSTPLYRPEVLGISPRHGGEGEPGLEELSAGPTKEGFNFETAGDLALEYREGRVSPLDVTERFIAIREATETLHLPSRIFVAHDEGDLRKQAEASAQRWSAGKPISVLDGIPIAVKDEMDQSGYPTTVGTQFLGGKKASTDSEVVARLRAAGALLVGKTNMHELGIGVTGINPHHGTPRNPYSLHHVPGGSSSGSAAAVASGLCPMAVGLDGGGSIRIPASFCGVVGLKATYGRLSLHGAAPLAWTVGHVGPIAASVRDAAVMYRIMAGEDPKDQTTIGQPEPDLRGILDHDLRGIRVGVYPPWFEDADDAVVAACNSLVAVLERAGAEVLEIVVPGLSLLRSVHLISITGEMAGALIQEYEPHQRELGLETRINLALARKFQAYDYVHAARHRRQVCETFTSLLEDVDVIATPTTACTAPRASEKAFLTGESNVSLVGEIMRYAAAANTTGLPAISVPAGYDEDGMPIGFQMLGRAWEEALLLRLAAVCESTVESRQPSHWWPLLSPNDQQG